MLSGSRFPDRDTVVTALSWSRDVLAANGIKIDLARDHLARIGAVGDWVKACKLKWKLTGQLAGAVETCRELDELENDNFRSRCERVGLPATPAVLVAKKDVRGVQRLGEATAWLDQNASAGRRHSICALRAVGFDTAAFEAELDLDDPAAGQTLYDVPINSMIDRLEEELKQ